MPQLKNPMLKNIEPNEHIFFQNHQFEAILNQHVKNEQLYSGRKIYNILDKASLFLILIKK